MFVVPFFFASIEKTDHENPRTILSTPSNPRKRDTIEL